MPERTPRPRDAAALILIDDSAAEPRILLGKRHEGHVFMSGKYVFPGGRVEASDSRMNVFGPLQEHVEARLMARVQRPSPQRARAYALAAIREMAEETGIFIGSTDFGPPDNCPPQWEIFREAGIYPILDELSFIARAVTPPGRVRRFDTRFFAVSAQLIGAERPGHITADSELTELKWVTLEESLALDVPRITRAVLDDLALRLKTGLTLDSSVPFYRWNRGGFIREEI